MKILPISVLTALITLHCCPAKNSCFKPDEVAEKIFTAKELKGILKMINYVDELVVEKTNIKDANEAYHTYFEELKPYILKGEMFPALLKDTIKFKFLEDLDKKAFEAVWRMNYINYKSIKYKDTVIHNLKDFEHFGLNASGSFMDYLDGIGESDEGYEKTSEAIKMARDISPSAVAWLPTHHSQYDFNTFKDRLWATVILLRIGDPLDEKEERYLHKKDLKQ